MTSMRHEKDRKGIVKNGSATIIRFSAEIKDKGVIRARALGMSFAAYVEMVVRRALQPEETE